MINFKRHFILFKVLHFLLVMLTKFKNFTFLVFPLNLSNIDAFIHLVYNYQCHLKMKNILCRYPEERKRVYKYSLLLIKSICVLIIKNHLGSEFF